MGPVGISVLCLEEDSARKLDTYATIGGVLYNLDRLGLPLIEIATIDVKSRTCQRNIDCTG